MPVSIRAVVTRLSGDAEMSGWAPGSANAAVLHAGIVLSRMMTVTLAVNALYNNNKPRHTVITHLERW